jgi:(1->4)-alpha-D-glucan 1-alpha-D-glucosylmutase
MQDLSIEAIFQRSDEGLPKLWLLQRTLHFRRNRADLFGEHGSYEPLQAQGEKAEHAVAFSRGGDAVIVAPRLPLGLNGDWRDTTIQLADGQWTNILTSEKVAGGNVRLSELLKRFPVALLERARG